MADRADRRNAIWEQRNPLERLVQRIPGFRGYFGRENRREADRLLREFGVDHLDRVISELQRAARGAGLADLGTYGELIDQVEKLRNELRFADQGYSGFFDETKRDREEVLDRVYEEDERIVESAVSLSVGVDAGGYTLPHLRAEVRTLQRALEERRQVILGADEE